MSIDALKDSLREKIHANEDEVLENDLNRYSRKIHQCNLIIKRINCNLDKFYRVDEKLWTLTEGKEGNFEDNDNIMDEYQDLSSLITFDVEDYFIHIQILIDRIAILLSDLIKEIPRKKISSFKELCEFIESNELNSKFFQYISIQQKWIILLINVQRNNLIIHDVISEFTGTSYSKKKIPTPLRIVIPENQDSERIIALLNKIKQDHTDDIPELKDENNIWKILLVCDYNAEKLSNEEIAMIIKIHKKNGGELPQIDIINKKIQEFLDQLNRYLENYSFQT